MKLNNLDNLSDAEMVAQYVLECRGSGTVLPYGDLALIRDWLEQAKSAERLLLILSDLLPEHFAKSQGRNTAPSLAAINRLVRIKLREG